MKYLLITLALIFCTLTSNAQLRLGIKTNYALTLGKSTTVQYGDENSRLLYELDYVLTKNCSSFGLSTYYETGYLFFQVDMMYRKCEVNFRLREYNVTNPENVSFYENYHLMHIPIAGGVQIKNFKIGVGPIINILLQGEMALTNMEKFEASPRDISMGFQFLIGYKLHKLVHLDLKFERSFNNVADHYKYSGTNTSLGVSPNILSVVLGLIL